MSVNQNILKKPNQTEPEIKNQNHEMMSEIFPIFTYNKLLNHNRSPLGF